MGQKSNGFSFVVGANDRDWCRGFQACLEGTFASTFFTAVSMMQRPGIFVYIYMSNVMSRIVEAHTIFACIGSMEIDTSLTSDEALALLCWLL